MAGFGVAARGRLSVATDSPTGPLPASAQPAAGGWLDTSSAAFWVAVWFVVLLFIVYAVFHGLLFS